ncbi:MAG TPA: helix-turn-helix transcriptional regulator [Pyrinomonadaceae bacterium]|nr:helix-turn-helix transcriptional regulator [Pyrinomonadaceae bacterium]
MKAKIGTVETGSGNVFADLGFQDAEDRLLKAEFATRIAQLIERKGWSQSRTADRLALDDFKVSQLLRGQLSGFSMHDLVVILNILGRKV